MLLANGLLPAEPLRDAVRRSAVPVLCVATPSYLAANRIHDLLVKIRPTDHQKIEIVRGLIRDNVNVDRIVERLDL